MPLPHTPLALLLFVLFVLLALLWPTWRLWRREGINPYVLPSGEGAEAYVGRGFRGVLLALMGVLVLQSLWPRATLAVLPWAHWGASLWGGLALSGLALAWTGVAQAQMGSAWRVGIDTRQATPLVARGLFALSRNPIFLGMRVALLGLLLAVPDASVLLLVALGEVLMQVQVRLEEAHLQRLHGTAYTRYCQQVGRWLGWR
jgi:protein-S-isoprenylcysteine O-methyltransferase Ste14